MKKDPSGKGDLPFGPGVRVVKRDPNGLWALDKPAGVLSHPNRAADRARSLFQLKFDPEAEAFVASVPGEEPRRIWLLNRLDSATSGLILVALNSEVAAAVKACFKQRRVHKSYQALVFGHARVKRQEWVDRMAVKTGANQVRASGAGGLNAETTMNRLRLIPGPPAMSLLELIPRTGRTHQLRFQSGKRRLPIVGDQTYGDFRANREFARRTGNKRLFLHSGSVRLEYDFKGHGQTFAAQSPLPPDFRSVLPGKRQ